MRKVAASSPEALWPLEKRTPQEKGKRKEKCATGIPRLHLGKQIDK